jgi:hypothetical protein
MTTAKTLKVNRERLITSLKERLAEDERTRERVFADALAAEVRDAEKDAASATKRAERLRKAKTPDDLPDEYWARRLDDNGTLAQHIRLLELSDEDTITIGPTHDLFRWI